MRTIYLDPAYKAYYEDRLFDDKDAVLNRDDTLAPFIRLRDGLRQHGVEVHTADYLVSAPKDAVAADYYSFGVLENYRSLSTYRHLGMRAFVVFEPPVVAPQLYRELPALTATFDRVYVHNTEGDGYSLQGVDQSRLRKLYWPQPRAEVMENIWQRRDRQQRIVVINGNHKPASFTGELYSKRIEVMAELARYDAVDLYGRDWNRWWSRNSMWLPYWWNRSKIMSVYKGPCSSKYEVMGAYAFALCFENMAMKGYVTEKIFDCFYAGTIPIYWGATDISSLIPSDSYIDYREFSSATDLWTYVKGMSESEIAKIREAGKAFIGSSGYARHYDFLRTVVQE